MDFEVPDRSGLEIRYNLAGIRSAKVKAETAPEIHVWSFDFNICKCAGRGSMQMLEPNHIAVFPR